MSNVKNYTDQGGAVTHIGGTLAIESGASVTGITTATIVDNLTSTDTDKALSANQGKALKTLVDAKYTAANATISVAGVVKMLANVPEAAGANPTAAEFKALLDALIAAGVMASAT